jgi:hypothetical protein
MRLRAFRSSGWVSLALPDWSDGGGASWRACGVIRPYSPVMERFCIPDKARIIAGIREVLT